jgi:hypothetical protein
MFTGNLINIRAENKKKKPEDSETATKRKVNTTHDQNH